MLTSFGGTDDRIYKALALQTDGKIVAAGWSNASGHYEFALAHVSLFGP